MRGARIVSILAAVMVCLWAGISTADDSVKIGLLAGFTGVASIPSYHLLHTAKMEVAEMNANGGVGGKPIKLVILDDESNPMRTRELANSSDLDDVVGVIGFPWSQFMLAAAPILQERGIPSISILATHDKAADQGDYIMRVCFTNSYQGQKLAQYAYEKKGARRALIMVNLQNTYSTDLAEVIARKFKSLGGEVVAEVQYIPQHGVDHLVSELKKYDPAKYDSVFIPDNQIYVMPVMQAFLKIGAVDKLYFGGDGWNMANLQLKDEAFNKFKTYVIGHWNKENASKRNTDFIRKFESRTGTDAQDATALSHDALNILVQAVRRAGSEDRRAVLDELKKTDYAGLSGRIRFDANGNVSDKPLVIHEVLEGRRKSILYR